MQVSSVDVTYNVTTNMDEEDAVIQRALAILSNRLMRGPFMDSPDVVKNFLIMAAAEHQFTNEKFGVLFLDSAHMVIELDFMFHGTINQTSVYAREVARKAMMLNASAVILTHNHPSGNMSPSAADKRLTNQLKQTLELVDVRVLDHIITGAGESYSFAEHGLI